MDLGRHLIDASSPSVDPVCRILRLNPNDPQDRRQLEELVTSKTINTIHDCIQEQLAGLLKSRRPDRRWTAEDMRTAIEEHLGGLPSWRYGTWCYFSWSRRLVHLLPAEEFHELRLDRNRYQITREEQAALGCFHIGIVGLSVGQASAMCLATEGVGGQLRLADFDTLGLSNLNRLRAGVHELGLPKTVLAARAIYELDPYADLALFHDGIDENNLDAFLLTPRPLDLLIEECDDLAIKVRLRQRAKTLGIPVLMDTCDRGLIDIERFDREPNRPLFHGLAGDLRADELRGLSTADKVPYVLRILGENQISERTLATLVEADQTVSSWPQLASGVTLGAALVCHVARRILLGQLHCSGRFYVDLDELIRPSREFNLPDFQPIEQETAPEALEQRAAAPQLARHGTLDPTVMRDLLAHGVLAISGGNCQPWRFIIRGSVCDCSLDPQRTELFLDFAHTASHLAMGSVLENLELAADRVGLHTDIELFPSQADPQLIARIKFEKGQTAHPLPKLADQITSRATNRRLGARQPLPEGAKSDMRQAAESAGAEILWCQAAEELDELGQILGQGDRLRFLSKIMHTELMSELRWTRKEVESTRDGIDIMTMELSAADRAAMRVVANWSAMKMVEHIGGGRALEKISYKAVAAASAIGLLRVPGCDARSYVQGGRAVQRVWLAATAHDLAFQPMTAINYVWARLERSAGEGLSDKEKKKFEALRQRYAQVLPVSADMAEIMLFRVAIAPAPSARALRRPVEEVCVFSP